MIIEYLGDNIEVIGLLLTIEMCSELIRGLWTRLLCSQQYSKCPFYAKTNYKSIQRSEIKRISQFHTANKTLIFGNTMNMTMKSSKIQGSLRYVECKLLISSSFSTTSLASDEPNFAMLATELLSTAKSFDVMAGSIPVGTVSALLKSLHMQGLSMQASTELLSRCVWLIKQHDDVIAIIELLKSYGLKSEITIAILKNIPYTFQEGSLPLSTLLNVISSSFENFRNLGLTEADVRMLLASDPDLLFKDPKTCRSVLRNLKGLLPATDAICVLRKSPNILSDPWTETQNKFHYAFFTMGCDLYQIMNSSLFSHSFEHIVNRHIYLIKTGFFVPVKKKNAAKLNPNPKLADVVDTSDELFVDKFGGMSIEEFSVYLEMMQLEHDENELQDSDTDNSGDEESDEDSGSNNKTSNKEKIGSDGRNKKR
ncbi:unnamed protein product [Lymnaea stagnalis]|uniref:mTERF domain-containing protein 2 n=1 Tax=Lymnaea stagnalis TaxID=6523 RepID=A0AAV2HDU8_LYMST